MYDSLGKMAIHQWDFYVLLWEWEDSITFLMNQ
jgi:hypothetical protein